jgi:hypothetical protein
MTRSGLAGEKRQKAALARRVSASRQVTARSHWITSAKHPQSGRLYTEMVYQPMVEHESMPQ